MNFKTLAIMLMLILSSSFALANIDNVSVSYAPGDSFIQGTSGTGTLTLENTGSSDISSILVTLSDVVDLSGSELDVAFSESDVNLLVGESKDVTLTFTSELSDTFGTYGGEVTITVDDAGHSDDGQSAMQSVTAQVLELQETISTAGSVGVEWVNGASSATSQTITVTSTGNVDQAVTVSVSDLTGPSTVSSVGIDVSNAGFSLATGESVDVTFTPENLGSLTVGTYSGTITISHGSASTDVPISLVVRDGVHSLSAVSILTFDGNIRGNTVTKTITVTNTGDFDEHNLAVDDSLSGFSASVSPASIVTIAAGESASIDVTVSVPDSANTVSQSIGNVTVSNADVETVTEVVVAPSSKLSITDLDVKVGSKTDKGLEDGDTIGDEAEPGDEVTFKIEVSNLFTDDEDIEIQNIEVEITIVDIDDGDDIDLDSSDFDLDADDDEDVELSFTVPTLVDEDTYDVIISVSGEDEDNVDHSLLWTLQLEVEKESHKLILERAILSPTVVSCSRTSTIDVRVVNVGGDDEENVRISAFNSDIGLDYEKHFEVDEGNDDDAREQFEIRVNTDDIAPGVYPIKVELFRGSSREETQTLELTVQDCNDDYVFNDNNVRNDDRDADSGFDVVTSTPVSVPNNVVSSGNSFRDSGYYMPTLVAIVLLLGIVVFFVMPRL